MPAALARASARRLPALVLGLLVIALALLLAQPAAARTVLDLDTSAQPVPLLDWGDAWIEPGHSATAAEVAGPASPARWEPMR